MSLSGLGFPDGVGLDVSLVLVLVLVYLSNKMSDMLLPDGFGWLWLRLGLKIIFG